MGKCQNCETYDVLCDTGLCLLCDDMLERDLIRSKDWERSRTVWASSKERQENVRNLVIEKFGAAYELIIDPETIKQ